MTDVTTSALFDEAHFDDRANTAMEASSCRALWLAVLAQAVRDVSGPPVGVTPNEQPVRVHQAHEFLSGRDRGLRIVCDLAGVSADKVADRYQRGQLRLEDAAYSRRAPNRSEVT